MQANQLFAVSSTRFGLALTLSVHWTCSTSKGVQIFKVITVVYNIVNIEPAHDKSYNKSCVTSKGSGQSVYHLVWKGFSFILLWISRMLYKAYAITEDSDQTARMRRLI